MFSSNRSAIVLSVSMIAGLFVAQTHQADILVLNSIQPFNTSLGTLDSVTVTLDPNPAFTSPYETNFSSMPNHAHGVLIQPVNIAGLGSFSFAVTQTSLESSGVFDTHSHTVNVPATFQTFTGPSLAWFLNPANPTISSINVGIPQTSVNQGHNHAVFVAPIVPHVVYNYTPVPEPTSAALLTLAGAMLLRRRR